MTHWFLGLEAIGPDVEVTVSGSMNQPPYQKDAGIADLFGKAQALYREIGKELNDVPLTGGGSDGNFTAALGIPTLDGQGADGKGGHRAGDVVVQIRAFIQKAPPRKDRVDLNAAIREVTELTRGEAVKNGVSVQAQLADGLPLIHGDRVQLQQVVLNLVINAVEAMSGVSEGARDLLISTGEADSDGVLVAVMDSGPGLDSASLDRLFDAFYTTKPGGLGMGLSICRSIIDAHGGRLWASAKVPQGAILQFVLPAHPGGAL